MCVCVCVCVCVCMCVCVCVFFQQNLTKFEIIHIGKTRIRNIFKK